MRKLLLGAMALVAIVPIAGCGIGAPPLDELIAGQTVNMTVGPSPQTVFQGGSTSYTVTLTTEGGGGELQTRNGDSYALTLEDMPPGGTYSFNPSSVTPTVNGATSTLTISTTNQQDGQIRGGAKSRLVDTGTYTMIVRATKGNSSISKNFVLTVDSEYNPE